MINQYLKNNIVNVKRKGKQVRILDSKSYVKSADAGNYSFDPFCDSVEIYVCMTSKGEFVNDFRVESGNNDIDIKPEKVTKFS